MQSIVHIGFVLVSVWFCFIVIIVFIIMLSDVSGRGGLGI